MIIDREEVRWNYPDTLSLEDVRSILYISKRKAAWMLQNGIIKCEIGQKKTKQYHVRLEDLFVYLDKVERDDVAIQIPIGIFNAKKPSGKEKKSRLRSMPTRSEKPTKAFKEWLTDKWNNESEMLGTSDISRLTGYTQQTVQRWTKQGSLRSVKTKNKLVVAKEWLIDFYCEEAYKIVQKCEMHRELMRNFYTRNEK